MLMKFLETVNDGDVMVPCLSSPGAPPVSNVLIRLAPM
jgi:hypothetical protein